MLYSLQIADLFHSQNSRVGKNKGANNSYLFFCRTRRGGKAMMIYPKGIFCLVFLKDLTGSPRADRLNPKGGCPSERIAKKSEIIWQLN